MTLGRVQSWINKFKQALHTTAPSTPVNKKRDRSASRSPPKSSPKSKKNKARRARQKLQLQKARATLAAQSAGDKSGGPKKPSRDERVPAKEWQTITSFEYSGPRRCPFYNCSLGCRLGGKQKHACVECGQAHLGMATTEQLMQARRRLAPHLLAFGPFGHASHW